MADASHIFKVNWNNI